MRNCKVQRLQGCCFWHLVADNSDCTFLRCRLYLGNWQGMILVPLRLFPSCTRLSSPSPCRFRICLLLPSELLQKSKGKLSFRRVLFLWWDWSCRRILFLLGDGFAVCRCYRPCRSRIRKWRLFPPKKPSWGRGPPSSWEKIHRKPLPGAPAVDVLPPIACHGGTRDSCSGFGE